MKVLKMVIFVSSMLHAAVIAFSILKTGLGGSRQKKMKIICHKRLVLHLSIVHQLLIWRSLSIPFMQIIKHTGDKTQGSQRPTAI